MIITDTAQEVNEGNDWEGQALNWVIEYFIGLNCFFSVHQQHQHLHPHGALNIYCWGLLWNCVGALKPWHLRKMLFLKKETSLSSSSALASCLGVVSRTKETSCSVEEEWSGVKKKNQMCLRVPSQKLLWRRMLTSRYSECVVACVFRDTFTFSEGLWRKLSKPRSFIFSGPSALLSSAGGFPSSPFALFSRLL